MSSTKGKGFRLPGFGLSMGYTMFYLSALVLIPLSTLLISPVQMGWEKFWATVTSSRLLASYALSFSTAFFAASFNAIFGLMAAWVLVRYDFWGKKFLDALVDIPFALPTAVAGIAMATLFSPVGWLGAPLTALGIKVINTPVGITLALIFIGFPFVVRTVQPVLRELEAEWEESALSLGATQGQAFLRVIFPNILPALLTGFTLAFSRSIGEYGSVIFIAGNIPFKTEIAPLLIMAKLDQFDYAGASAVALTLLVLSFISLLVLNRLQSLGRRPR